MASALLPSSELRYYQTTYGDQYGYNERARKFHRHYGLISSPDDPKFAQGKPVDLATAPLFRRDHFNFRKEYPTHAEYSTQRIARELEMAQTARAALTANRPIRRPSTVDPSQVPTKREPIYLWRPPVVKSPTAPTTYTDDGTPIAPYINKQHQLQAERQAMQQQQQLAIRQQQAARHAHTQRETIPSQHSSHEMGSTWSRNAGISFLDTQPTYYRQHPSTLARSVDVVQSTASTLRPQTVPASASALSHPLFGMRPVEVSTAISCGDRTTIPGLSTTIHHHPQYHA